jgi:hypothetical protein
MLNAKYTIGQKVRIIPLIDGFGRPDPRIREWVGKAGEVVKSYYVSGDEVWEKTLKLEDTYCYDIRLDGGGDVARGIPELSIELFIH